MLFDLINFDKLRRAIFYAAMLAVCVVVQNLVFSRIHILGARPMFIPCAVVAVGVVEGGIWGGVFGLIAGLLTDLAYIETLVLFTITLPIIGYAAGEVTKRFINRGLFSYVIFCAASLAVCVFLQSFDLLFFSNTNRLGVIIVAFLQIFWSLPFCFAIYYPCLAISENKKGAVP